MLKRASPTLLAICLAAGTAAAGALGPEWSDLRSPAWRDLRTAVVQEALPLHVLTFGAPLRRELARSLDPILVREPGSSPRRRLERELAEELRLRRGEASPGAGAPWVDRELDPGRLRLRPTLDFAARWNEGTPPGWTDGPRLGLDGTLHLDSRVTLAQHLFVGRVPGGRRFADALVAHTDLLLLFESAFAGYASDRLELRAGRFRQAYGPGRSGGLLLSPDAAPIDQIEYALRGRSLRFRAMYGVLSAATDRRVAMHRLEWSPSERWLLGLSEGAAFQGGGAPNLYLLGFVPYTLVERVQGQDAVEPGGVDSVRNNVLWQLDATFRSARAGLFWSSLLLDDVATESSAMPSRLGLQLGWELAPRTRGWQLAVEAVKVWNYTYSVFYQSICPCDWVHQGTAIGYPGGPDLEQVELSLEQSVSEADAVEFRLLRQSKGEGRLGDPWIPAPVLGDRPTSSDASRLSGTVEQILRLECAYRHEPFGGLASRVGIAARWAENEGNLGAPWRLGWETTVRLSAHR
ncbi:MAG: hypothetical protein IT349_16120 [Candidatus Eisenbacteria bacterium]|nr:hypothetical protein [Candidatus Eisenbacteria bacterium]